MADVVRVELGSGSFQPVDPESALVPNRKSTNTIYDASYAMRVRFLQSETEFPKYVVM